MIDKIELEQMFGQLEKILEGELPDDEFRATRDWGGADVIITKKPTIQETKWLTSQRTVLSFQFSQSTRILIVTKYHKELSWLFNKLLDIAATRIDYISKYDFYRNLAIAAIDTIEAMPEVASSRMLLSAVTEAARNYLLP